MQPYGLSLLCDVAGWVGWSSAGILFITRKPFNLTIYIPFGLFQILYSIAFFTSTPDVFNGITSAKIHMLGYVDALYAAGVISIVFWVIYWISINFASLL